MKSPPQSADTAKATAGKSEEWHIPWHEPEHTQWRLPKDLLGELVQVLHYLLS